MKSNRTGHSLVDDSTNALTKNALTLGLTAEQCYKAFLSRDSRFDGRLFVGVSSTGIFCRPVCRVKPPLAKNCRFFSNMALAQSKGFRPCLRCRPELAPGFSETEAASHLAYACASALQYPGPQSPPIEQLAQRIGVTSRHLRRLFNAEFGVSPIAYAQTQRLLLAKRLLTDTALPVSMVSDAAGFKSVRRMNTCFQEQYRLAPSKLRKESIHESPNEQLTVQLTYRPPYAWKEQLAFLAARCLSGVEWVDVNRQCYWRTVRIEGASKANRKYVYAGWVRVAQNAKKHCLDVTLSQSLAPVIGETLLRVRRLFDLDARPEDIEQALSNADSEFDLRPILKNVPGLRLAGAFDPFETAMRAILGQLVSVKAAHVTASKLVAEFGEPLELHSIDGCPNTALNRLAPTAAAILSADPDRLGALGLTKMKQSALQGLANALVSGSIELSPTVDVDQTVSQLKAIRGIGDWTAQYLAMRALAWPDAFPNTDYGVLKALNCKPAEAVRISQSWRPWRAYATRYLWQSLENQERKHKEHEQ